MSSNPRNPGDSLKALWKCKGLLESDQCSFMCPEPCLSCSGCGGAAGNGDQWVNPTLENENSGSPGSAGPQGVLSQGLHPKPPARSVSSDKPLRVLAPWPGQGQEWGMAFSPSSRKQTFSFPVLLNVGSLSPCAFSTPARREVTPLCILQQGSRAGLLSAGADP